MIWIAIGCLPSSIQRAILIRRLAHNSPNERNSRRERVVRYFEIYERMAKGLGGRSNNKSD